MAQISFRRAFILYLYFSQFGNNSENTFTPIDIKNCRAMSILSSPQKDYGEKSSGIHHKKSGWRSVVNRCCCRNGFYPVVVAPIITGAWLLDIYCSAGCDFVRLDIGFEPMNEAWNQTSVNLGFFLYDASSQNVADVAETSGNMLLDTFHPSCRTYESAFDSFFIDGDQTWTVSYEIQLVFGFFIMVFNVAHS